MMGNFAINRIPYKAIGNKTIKKSTILYFILFLLIKNKFVTPITNIKKLPKTQTYPTINANIR